MIGTGDADDADEAAVVDDSEVAGSSLCHEALGSSTDVTGSRVSALAVEDTLRPSGAGSDLLVRTATACVGMEYSVLCYGSLRVDEHRARRADPPGGA